jgi:acyl carrier protein
MIGSTPPLTNTEQMLATLWAETLGVERVDVDENFFDLGGDSLLAFRLVSRVASEYGIDASPEMIFDLPTVRELARAIDGRLGRSS